jgi:hypothetical protein
MAEHRSIGIGSFRLAALARPRYHVATVSGYLSTKALNNPRGPGISAHVVDRACAAQVVATFRSEDRVGKSGLAPGRDGRASLGKDRALAAAAALAAKLNADDAR